MGFFTAQTKVVAIDEENSVTVRKLTYGERDDAMSIAFNNGNDNASVAAATVQRELLCRAVVAWAGPGFEGREVNKENILALPYPVADKILEDSSGFLQGISEDEKKA